MYINLRKLYNNNLKNAQLKHFNLLKIAYFISFSHNYICLVHTQIRMSMSTSHGLYCFLCLIKLKYIVTGKIYLTPRLKNKQTQQVKKTCIVSILLYIYVYIVAQIIIKRYYSTLNRVI